MSAITEENMIYFLGKLEEKGIEAISDYAKLIAEQLKLEKGDQPGVAQQIEDLTNIIAYENANIMNYYSTANQNKITMCPGKYILFICFKQMNYWLLIKMIKNSIVRIKEVRNRLRRCSMAMK